MNLKEDVMKPTHALLLFFCLLLPFAAAWAESNDFTSEFDRERCTFVTVTSNPYFPLWPGYRLILEGVETDQGEMVERRSHHTVLPETELVDGVLTRVVEHREWEDDELIEVSRDFYAVCRETGAVWYFGEDVDVYEDGVVTGHPGGWRAGLNGARPGIIMPGTPLVGARYQQELAPGVAEDRGEIVSIGQTMTVPAGTFHNILEITDTNPLDPEEEDAKFYALGVVLIQDEVEKLVEIVDPPCRPDDTTLCLSDGRFKVQAAWREPRGATGMGHTNTHSDDSGSFWFFGPENSEVMVKLLDACALEGFGNFWFFAAGMTNVEVTLTVTDTRTGEMESYRNQLNRPFEPVLDTAAFTTCP